MFDSLRNVITLYRIGALFTLAAPLAIGILMPDSRTLWVVALCGAFVMCLSKLDDVSLLWMGPSRTELIKAMSAAHATIDKLHTVSASAVQITLTDLMTGNFGQRTDLGARLDLHDNVMNALRNLSSDAEVVNLAESQWSRGIGVIYHQLIQRHLDTHFLPNVDADAPSEALLALGAFRRMVDMSGWYTASPDEMESFLTKGELIDDETLAWISDYRYFLSTKAVRRREKLVAAWEA